MSEKSEKMNTINIEVNDMNTQEKLNYLIEKGIPIKTIAKYANYNETHISKYAKNLINVSTKCINNIETGINKLLQDLEVLK